MPADSTVYSIRNAIDLECALDDIATRRERRNDLAALLHMDVCPMGLFSKFVAEAVRLYMESQSRPLPWAIYQEPAIYARAREVIEAELAAIRKEQSVQLPHSATVSYGDKRGI
jgi:hypothetical protein